MPAMAIPTAVPQFQQSPVPVFRVSPRIDHYPHARMSAMASRTGKPGPDPYLGYTPVQAKVWMSESARDLLKDLAERHGQANGAYLMSLLARDAGVPLETLMRDKDQEVLPQSA